MSDCKDLERWEEVLLNLLIVFAALLLIWLFSFHLKFILVIFIWSFVATVIYNYDNISEFIHEPFFKKLKIVNDKSVMAYYNIKGKWVLLFNILKWQWRTGEKVGERIGQKINEQRRNR